MKTREASILPPTAMIESMGQSVLMQNVAGIHSLPVIRFPITSVTSMGVSEHAGLQNCIDHKCGFARK